MAVHPGFATTKRADCDRANRQVGTPKSYNRGVPSCENESESSDMRETPMTQSRPNDEAPIQVGNNLPFAMPPKDMIAEAIALYFQYCHKQPLWLFDVDDFLIPEKSRS